MSLGDAAHTRIGEAIREALKAEGCSGDYFLLFAEEKVSEDGEEEMWKTGCMTTIPPDKVSELLETVLEQVAENQVRIEPVIMVAPNARKN